MAKEKSKFLSMLLRHKPEELGLSMDENGWVLIKDLLEKTKWSLSALDYIVITNNKKRFEYDETKDKIRAVQGHTIEVELDLEKIVPPGILYHGTTVAIANKIIINGLKKMKRNHVHLSSNMEVAKEVGQRYGIPSIIFTIDTTAMVKDGHQFYVSNNGVFLIDQVPAKYLKTGLWINE